MNRLIKYFTILGLVVSLLLNTSLAYAIHPMGLCASKLQYANNQFVFEARLFWGDFNYEIQEFAHVKNKNYEALGFDKLDYQDFQKYFEENFGLKIEGSPVTFQLREAKLEPHEDVFVLYVKLASRKLSVLQGSNLTIFNSILPTIGNQKNIVQLLMNDTPSGLKILTFDKSNKEQTVAAP